MTSKDPAAPGFKQKAIQEFRSFAAIALYLAFFFCALSTYSMLLLRKYDVSYLNYAFSLINALIVAKIILGGEMMHLGRGVESRPLYQAILYKSLLFGVLVFVFHIVEEVVKRIIHHQPRGTVLHNLDMDDLIARAIVIFAAFVPLFTIRELGRVLGEEKLHALLFKSGAAANPTLSPTQP